MVCKSLSCMAIWFWPAGILLLRGTVSSLAAFAWSNPALSVLIARRSSANNAVVCSCPRALIAILYAAFVGASVSCCADSEFLSACRYRSNSFSSAATLADSLVDLVGGSGFSVLALKASPFARWHLWHSLRKPLLRYGFPELVTQNLFVALFVCLLSGPQSLSIRSTCNLLSVGLPCELAVRSILLISRAERSGCGSRSALQIDLQDIRNVVGSTDYMRCSNTSSKGEVFYLQDGRRAARLPRSVPCVSSKRDTSFILKLFVLSSAALFSRSVLCVPQKETGVL